MKVVVTGTVMDVIKNEGKDTYSHLLYQAGERELVEVRTKSNSVTVGEVMTYSGRVFAFRSREGVRVMVMADDE